MRALAPRESRLIAVLVLVAALALAYLVAIQPLVGGFADRASAREALLTRYAANNRTIAAIPRLGRQAAAHSRQTAHYTLIAADRTAAADQLRDRMQSVANAAGGEFHGAEDVTAAPGTVAARVAMRVPAGKLANVIAAIENAPPYLTITGLAVSADDALVSGTASNLDVKLDIAIAFRPAATR